MPQPLGPIALAALCLQTPSCAPMERALLGEAEPPRSDEDDPLGGAVDPLRPGLPVPFPHVDRGHGDGELPRDLLGLRQAGENREGIVSDEVDLALFELADKLCVRAPALLDTYAGRRRLS